MTIDATTPGTSFSEDPDPVPNEASTTTRVNLLSAHHLTFSYGARPVLRDASISLTACEVVALIGPNGSGKSTLLRALLGQLQAAGTIEWEARPLGDWRRRELARLVAYLPQNPAWEPQQTVADVLRLGRAPYLAAFGLESERDIKIVRDVAQTLDLVDLLDRPLDALSGGQRQRVFIGRCLAQEPKAMLLDEPNTFLDLKHQVELGRLLKSLARDRGIAILMASHDLNLASYFAGRLVLLSQGQIVADGPARTVLEPESLEQVYGLRMERIDRQGTVLVFPAADQDEHDAHAPTSIE